MSENMLIGILKDAIFTSLKIAGPVLAVSIIIGLTVSLFQATTQIQEQTLTFVPKLIAIAVTLLITVNFIHHSIISFTERIFDIIANIV